MNFRNYFGYWKSSADLRSIPILVQISTKVCLLRSMRDWDACKQPKEQIFLCEYVTCEFWKKSKRPGRLTSL